MFRDVYADRYEIRVRFTEALLWEWEIWDLKEARLMQTSSELPEGRFLSSRDAHTDAWKRAAAVALTAR
jgi:hypothetical protein